MRALSKSPGARYGSARTFVSALREAYEGKAPHVQKRNGRRRLATLAALVALVAVWLLLQRDRQHSSTTIVDADTETAVTDAETPAEPDTTTPEDPDPGSTLSPHEREEAAKDQLARARAAIEDGDLATATSALDTAAELDPTNPDIDALRAEVTGASVDDDG
jgi:hypothetical protein